MTWPDSDCCMYCFFCVFYSLVGQLAFHPPAKNPATPLECPPKACLAQLNRPPISWLADVDVGTESLSFHRVFSSRCKNSIYLFGKCQCFRPHHSVMPGFTNSFPFSQVAHPLFGHTLSFRRSVASQTEAFVGHAAGQTTRGVALGPATLTSGVQVAHIFGLRRAFGGFLQGATKVGKPWKTRMVS